MQENYIIGDFPINSKFYLKDKFIFNNFLLPQISDEYLYRGYIDKNYLLNQLNIISKTNSKLIIILSPVNKKIYKLLNNLYICPEFYFIDNNKYITQEILVNINHQKTIIQNFKNIYNINNVEIVENFDIRNYENIYKDFYNIFLKNTHVNLFGIFNYHNEFNSSCKLMISFVEKNDVDEYVFYYNIFEEGVIKIPKNKYINIFKLDSLVTHDNINYSDIFETFSIETFSIELFSILILNHCFNNNDGLSLEMEETIDFLLNYFPNINIFLLTLTQTKDNDFKFYKSTSKSSKTFNVIYMKIDLNVLSSRLYLYYFHECFQKIINIICPKLVFIAFQACVFYHHFINLCNYYKIQIILRWSGSKIMNNEEIIYTKDSLKKSNLLIKIGDEMIDNYPIKNVTHFACNTSFFEVEIPLINLKLKYGLDPKKFVFICIGRICSAKNTLFIVKSFLKSIYYQSCYLLLIGDIKDNIYWSEIESLLNDNIKHFSIEYKNMGEIYKIANSLIFCPLFGEGMSRCLLESLINKIPVICINKFNYKEYINSTYCILIEEYIELPKKIDEMYLNFNKYFNNLNEYIPELKERYSLETYKNLFDSFYFNIDANVKILKPYKNFLYIDYNTNIIDLKNFNIYKYNSYDNINYQILVFRNFYETKTLIVDFIITDEFTIEQYDNIIFLNSTIDEINQSKDQYNKDESNNKIKIFNCRTSPSYFYKSFLNLSKEILTKNLTVSIKYKYEDNIVNLINIFYKISKFKHN
jgi:hypothetical protein